MSAALRALVVGAAFVALTACGTTREPIIKTVEVKVPVATVCPKDLRAPPTTADTDAALRAAPGPAERYQLIAAGRLLKNQWIAEAWSVLSACK